MYTGLEYIQYSQSATDRLRPSCTAACSCQLNYDLPRVESLDRSVKCEPIFYMYE